MCCCVSAAMLTKVSFSVYRRLDAEKIAFSRTRTRPRGLPAFELLSCLEAKKQASSAPGDVLSSVNSRGCWFIFAKTLANVLCSRYSSLDTVKIAFSRIWTRVREIYIRNAIAIRI